MSGTDVIQVAQDHRTCFPVVRLLGRSLETAFANHFVALLPTTKLQVEQWLSEGGWGDQGDPMAIEQLLTRMEQVELNLAPDKYPERVQKLRRVPIKQCTWDNLPSIVATNLSLWTTPEEPGEPQVRYPTRTSEWGRFTQWLECEVPDYRTWTRILIQFAKYRTKDLLHEILQKDFSWPPVVRALLDQLGRITPEHETGLPLMNLGVYELVSDTKEMVKVTERPQRKMRRPFVAGDSALWPTLDTERRRVLLPSTLPVVTIRPWYHEGKVVGSEVDGQPNVIHVLVSQHRTSAPRLPSYDNKRGVRNGSSNGYFKKRVTMTTRCPVCYEKVDEKVFYGNKVVWCYLEEGIRRHNTSKPALVAGIEGLEGVHAGYLAVARKEADKIRSVCLGGWVQSGKTAYLLSLWGLMKYPSGSSRFPKAFPAGWEVDMDQCSTVDFIRGQTLINIVKQTEQMWIDGELPIRTVALRRALRCPVLFERTQRVLMVRAKKQQLILNFNDISGELMTQANDLSDNEDYPNISSTTDLIFLAPVHELRTAHQFLAMFANGFGLVEFEGKALDLKQINLILAISQIDRCKHSAAPDEQRLLEILMQKPYILPVSRREDDFQQYCATMQQIHYDLESWLSESDHVPDLVKAADRFASVSYCGFSSCGFQPVREAIRQGVEAWLPFEPYPVRVADPFLWLLRNNGLITF